MCVWDCDFIEKKYETKSQKMNRLKTVFLKICDLKTQKSVYLNRKQCGTFLKTQYFKMINCDFTKHLTVFLKIIFLNCTF
jgi:hypothetical protein